MIGLLLIIMNTLYTQGNKADMVVTGYCHDTMNEQRDELYVSRNCKYAIGFFWIIKS